MYQPIGKSGFITPFLEGLEPKLREKLVWRIYFLSHTPLEELKEPHYKHFSIERYSSLYEVRERGKSADSDYFYLLGRRDVLLLNAFLKRKQRDTMQALEQSLRILAELQNHPEYAVEFIVKEEQS